MNPECNHDMAAHHIIFLNMVTLILCIRIILGQCHFGSDFWMSSHFWQCQQLQYSDMTTFVNKYAPNDITNAAKLINQTHRYDTKQTVTQNLHIKCHSTGALIFSREDGSSFDYLLQQHHTPLLRMHCVYSNKDNLLQI